MALDLPKPIHRRLNSPERGSRDLISTHRVFGSSPFFCQGRLFPGVAWLFANREEPELERRPSPLDRLICRS